MDFSRQEYWSGLPFPSPYFYLCIYLGFPGGTSDKELACQCRRLKRHRFDPWVGKIPGRRAWQPILVFLPGESHGQKSLGRLNSMESQRIGHG